MSIDIAALYIEPKKEEVHSERLRYLEGLEKREEKRQSEALKKHGWPPALIKATGDSFDYLMRLKTGETWRFGEAEFLNDQFVRIQCFNSCGSGPEPVVADFPRGVDVRVSEIVWVADAPHGS